MAEVIKEELYIEEFEIKENIISNKEEILPSCTVEDACTEDTEIKGKFNILPFSTQFKMF